MGTPYRTPTARVDAYAPAWTRLQRLRWVSTMGLVLAIGMIAASAVTSSHLVMGLAVAAFLLHWVPASLAVESRCPHCKQPLFSQAVPVAGGGLFLMVVMPFQLFKQRACRACQLPFGTPAFDAATVVAAAAAARAQVDAATWLCGCGKRNEITAKKCERCRGIRLSPSEARGLDER